MDWLLKLTKGPTMILPEVIVGESRTDYCQLSKLFSGELSRAFNFRQLSNVVSEICNIVLKMDVVVYPNNASNQEAEAGSSRSAWAPV